MTLYFCHVHGNELVEDDNVDLFVNAADPDAAQRLWYLWMHEMFDDGNDVAPEHRQPPGSWYGGVVAEDATLYVAEVPSPAATGIVSWDGILTHARTIAREVPNKPHPCTDHLFVFAPDMPKSTGALEWDSGGDRARSGQSDTDAE